MRQQVVSSGGSFDRIATTFLRGAATLLLALAFLAGCDDHHSHHSTPTPTPVVTPAIPTATATPQLPPGLCPSLFSSLPHNTLQAADALAAPSPTPSPVALSTCSTDNGNVVIGTAPCGPLVYVDQSFTGASAFGTITIQAGGTLVFPEQTLTVETTGIDVQGTLFVGTADCPIGSGEGDIGDHVTIRFLGSRPATCTGSVGDAACHQKGILVESSGVLGMYGEKGLVNPDPGDVHVSWTHLSAPAGPGATYGPGHGVASPVTNGTGLCPNDPPEAPQKMVLQLTDPVDWQAGDWIVVGTTDFVEHGSEFVHLACVTNSGSTIYLDPATPLLFYHFGGPAPSTGTSGSCMDAEGNTVPDAFCDDYTQNYGVDERAEVALISRSITLTADVPPQDQTPSHWGGEITVMNGATAQIQGVEIEKFGKDQQGSYPIRLVGSPMLPTPNPEILPATVNSVSIHHSYNKGIVLDYPSGSTNGASNLMIVNNVVARAIGHLFYLVDGNETGNTFQHNVGLGAMTNSFSIMPSNSDYTPETAAQLFWSGDYLTNDASSDFYNGYDGFNVPSTDCNNPLAWATGFYITNPDNTFIDNSIGGCQGEGRGFWYLAVPKLTRAANGCPTFVYVPPPGTPNYTCVVQPVSSTETYLSTQFANNRAHACYTGLDTASDVGTDGATSLISCPLAPQYMGYDLITAFSGMTATRNRNRGIWVRPGWYHVDNARLATNRDSVSLVSSGGTEGSPPGEWSLLSNSILVGISANNPGRFGPCPYFGEGAFAGGQQGCVNESQSLCYGYPFYTWNLFGVMFYDGPARLQENKLINFLRDPAPYLMDLDQAALVFYADQPGNELAGHTPFQYEGDAAFGWFQTNVNSYPPTQYAENNTFENVDIRHEIYTQSVNQAGFADGDKNTVILDTDGTLTSYQVVGPSCSGDMCTPVDDKHPISLNNLPFLGTPYSVDECLAEGVQDGLLEKRPTSLISPQDYATLEFSMLTSSTGNQNPVTITKDQLDYNGQAGPQYDGMQGSGTQPLVECPANHSCMNLVGRNEQGVYEPKVINGLGYTVQAQSGLQSFVDVTYTDATAAGGISATNPFSTRLGLCYSSSSGQPAASLPYKTASCDTPPCPPFTVMRGRKSLGGPFGITQPALLETFWNKLTCNGLDNDDSNYMTDCPAAPTTMLTPATSIATLTADTYFYDTTTGLLFFYVEQSEPNGAAPNTTLPNKVKLPNGGGPSPLGSCVEADDPACLDADETFYSCPVDGCVLYSVKVEDTSYTPGASNCAAYVFPPTYDPTGSPPDYTQEWPTNLNQLAYKGGALDGQPVQPTPVPTNPGVGFNYPHSVDGNQASLCPTPLPSPPWISTVNPTPQTITTYTVGLPAGVSATFDPPVDSISTPSGPLFMMIDGTYTFTANDPGCESPPCSCMQTITVTGTTWTSSPMSGAGSNCCQLGLKSNPSTPAFVGPAAPPYNGSGCYPTSTPSPIPMPTPTPTM